MPLYIYIDESGKLYHEAKYQNYTAVVFTKWSIFREFEKEFCKAIKLISQRKAELVSKDGKEIKGSELWRNQENIDYQKILLTDLKNKKSYLKIFSVGVDLTGCKEDYWENEEQCIWLWTNMKQWLINDVIVKYFSYFVKGCYEKSKEKFIVNIHVDKETIREHFKEKIIQILSNPPSYLGEKLELVVKIGLDSKDYSGIQLADLVANGLQRNYQKMNNYKQFRKFFEEITEIKMPIVKIWRLGGKRKIV